MLRTSIEVIPPERFPSMEYKNTATNTTSWRSSINRRRFEVFQFRGDAPEDFYLYKTILRIYPPQGLLPIDVLTYYICRRLPGGHLFLEDLLVDLRDILDDIYLLEAF